MTKKKVDTKEAVRQAAKQVMYRDTGNAVLIHNGVVVVTGAHNTGKTTFALTSVLPDDLGLVYYHDAERSGNRALADFESQGLELGHYLDLEARFSPKPGKGEAYLPKTDDLIARLDQNQLPWATSAEQTALQQYWHHVKSDIAEHMIPGKYKVYIHDTIVTLEAGMAAWVQDHKGLGSGLAGWTTYGYGKMWTEGVYPLYRGFLQGIFDRGIELIILIAHLKSPWFGQGDNAKRIPGKVEPQGKPVLKLLSSLMLWLENADNPDGAPAGIVLKERLGSIKAVATGEDGKKRWSVRRMIPRRIPHCTWFQDADPAIAALGSIEYYLEHGCDLSMPKKGETLSQASKDMIGHTLTDAQMRYMVAEAETSRAVEQQKLVKSGARVPVVNPAQALSNGSGEVTVARAMVDQVKEQIEQAGGAAVVDTLREQIIGSAPVPVQARVAAAFDIAIKELGYKDGES